jgi:hypothetical protein
MGDCVGSGMQGRRRKSLKLRGHSNISISQRYVHPSEDAILNALSRLNGHNFGHNAETGRAGRTVELSINTSDREG